MINEFQNCKFRENCLLVDGGLSPKEGANIGVQYRTSGSSAVAAFSDGRPLRGRSLWCWAVRRFVVAARRLAYGY